MTDDGHFERRDAEMKRLRSAVDGWEPPAKCLACGADPMNRTTCFVCGAEDWEIFALRERALVEQLAEALGHVSHEYRHPKIGRALVAYREARAQEGSTNGEVSTPSLSVRTHLLGQQPPLSHLGEKVITERAITPVWTEVTNQITRQVAHHLQWLLRDDLRSESVW